MQKPLPGSELRDNIARLLRIQYNSVETEVRLERTTADVIFHDNSTSFFPKKIAVETKDWAKPLSSSDISTIYNLYRPSIDSGRIDFLLIIGRHVLSSSNYQSVCLLRNTDYLTYEHFLGRLMDFTALLHDNRLAFDNKDFSRNYIPSRVSGSSKLHETLIGEWLSSAKIGLMIYGGYGLGKTAFSYYIASKLSKDHLSGEFDRIPIRIALGGLYSKQDPEALICSVLSGTETGAKVKNFSYNLFLEMNRLGYFILILDGFDEMRHAMDIDDFVYTFESMRPLFEGSAKVVVLGRPDSFLSSIEERRVLSSMFEAELRRQELLETTEISFFSECEISTYLGGLRERLSTYMEPEQLNKFDATVSRVVNTEHSILSRPVQLQMFTSLVDDFVDNDFQLTRFELYSRFIYRFLHRESQKLARSDRRLESGQSMDEFLKERALFMQQVAWWVLTEKRENRFFPAELPRDIITRTIRPSNKGDAALRELLVGSVIEPMNKAGVLGNKNNRYYFFPHKSYVEFLVS